MRHDCPIVGFGKTVLQARAGLCLKRTTLYDMLSDIVGSHMNRLYDRNNNYLNMWITVNIFRHSLLEDIHSVAESLREVQTLLTISPPYSQPITARSWCECQVVGFGELKKCQTQSPLIWRRKGVRGGSFRCYLTKMEGVSVCLSFDYLDNRSSDRLYTWWVYCWGSALVWSTQEENTDPGSGGV